MIEVKPLSTTLRKAVNPELIATVEEVKGKNNNRTHALIQLSNENLIEVSNTFDEVINMIKTHNLITEEKTQ